LPAALGRFRERHPKVEVALRLGDTRQVLGMVRRGGVDLAVVGETREAGDPERSEGSRLMRRPYRSDELVLVVCPRHRWAQKGLPDIAELAEEALILRAR
jgi:DNA-binding transcriptional LysR family regulator